MRRRMRSADWQSISQSLPFDRSGAAAVGADHSLDLARGLAVLVDRAGAGTPAAHLGGAHLLGQLGEFGLDPGQGLPDALDDLPRGLAAALRVKPVWDALAEDRVAGGGGRGAVGLLAELDRRVDLGGEPY